MGDGWDVTPQPLLMPKFIEDGWEVHYIGDKRYRTPRNPQVGSRCHLPFHCDWKIASLFPWQNMLDVFKVGWGNCPILSLSCYDFVHRPFFKGRLCLSNACYRACVRSSCLCHGSDLSMGLAIKIAYKFATKMYSTFEQASSLFQGRACGSSDKGFRSKTPRTRWLLGYSDPL